jgi:hypothetical protein
MGSTAGEEASAQQLTGKVVKAERHTVYIQAQDQGAVIPLKVDSKTKFESPGVTSARDLKAGQEIRASFSVKSKTENLATSIEVSGQGGSGATLPESPTPGSTTPPGSTDQGTLPGSSTPGTDQGGSMGNGQGGSGTDMGNGSSTPGSSTTPDSTTPDTTPGSSTSQPGSSGSDSSGSSGSSTTPGY